MNRALAALAVLAALVALAGCAEPGPGQAGDDPLTSTSTSPPASTPTGTPTRTPQPGEVTVRGMVQEGVEAGCLLLRAPDGRQYLLLGGDRELLASQREVVVQGTPQPDLLTTCQQGIPFSVTDVQPA